jgi:hypothetical protein
VLVSVERNGPVWSAQVANDSIANLRPLMERFVDKRSHLKTDELHTFEQIGRQYGSHHWVNHHSREYARGKAHNNTAESYNALLERSKHGFFHYLSKKHLSRCLHEVGLRWNQREPELKVTIAGKQRIVMKRLPALTMLKSLLAYAPGRYIQRTSNGVIVCLQQA